MATNIARSERGKTADVRRGKEVVYELCVFRITGAALNDNTCVHKVRACGMVWYEMVWNGMISHMEVIWKWLFYDISMGYIQISKYDYSKQ